VIGVSGAALAERREAVKSFMKGMLRAYRWLHAPGHQAEAEQIPTDYTTERFVRPEPLQVAQHELCS